MAGSLPLLRSSVSCLLYWITLFEKGCVTFLFQKWTVLLPTGPSVTQVSLSPWGHPPGPSLPSLTLLIHRVPEVLTISLASCHTVTVTQDHLMSFWVLYLGSVGRTLRLTQEVFFTGINLKRLKMYHQTYPSFSWLFLYSSNPIFSYACPMHDPLRVIHKDDRGDGKASGFNQRGSGLKKKRRSWKKLSPNPNSVLAPKSRYGYEGTLSILSVG